mmetsp:Transcript_75157/g.151074  ORF Transcript_75157/g.151074 Transcript_75157/m.151074 type:complete len:247 (+) Transcript_75157:518-1258(+)
MSFCLLLVSPLSSPPPLLCDAGPLGKSTLSRSSLCGNCGLPPQTTPSASSPTPLPPPSSSPPLPPHPDVSTVLVAARSSTDCDSQRGSFPPLGPGDSGEAAGESATATTSWTARASTKTEEFPTLNAAAATAAATVASLKQAAASSGPPPVPPPCSRSSLLRCDCFSSSSSLASCCNWRSSKIACFECLVWCCSIKSLSSGCACAISSPWYFSNSAGVTRIDHSKRHSSSTSRSLSSQVVMPPTRA